MYRSTLFVHDGSPAADQAIRHAAALAVACRAQIVLVCVIEPLGPTLAHFAPESGWLAVPPAGVQFAQDVVAYERAEAVSQLHLAAARFRKLGVRSVRTSVIEGVPDDAIVSIAQREGCDLTIIGTRGHSTLRPFIESSVAERVVTRSRQPVLLVGSEQRNAHAASRSQNGAASSRKGVPPGVTSNRQQRHDDEDGSKDGGPRAQFRFHEGLGDPARGRSRACLAG